MMKKKIAGLISGAFLSAIVLAGCGSSTALQPVAINESVDVCETCHMAVKDNGYAAQIVWDEGQAHKFDDIGCLAKYTAQNEVSPESKIYIQDRNTKEWVDKEEAIFVDLMDVPTPMGYGIHTFKDHENADAFIKENGAGKMLHAADLDKYEWKQDKSKMLAKPMHMKNMMGN